MIPDAAYCLTCQRRPGRKEPPFNYPICAVCRDAMTRPLDVNWLTVAIQVLGATIALCWYTWPR